MIHYSKLEKYSKAEKPSDGFDLQPGDRFRFEGSDSVCVVTVISDYGVQLDFCREDTGGHGYTLLPQRLVRIPKE